MTLNARLEQWEATGVISAEQRAALGRLSREEPFSVFLELNILFYAGILAFVAGLGWTITTWSHQLGDILVLAGLSLILAACFWYCFSRPPGLMVDYSLYLGSLTWSVELGYIENRFHILSGQWDFYLLATAALFFFLAYRFDNRVELSLALTSLAGWFGLTISHWPLHQTETYRKYAIFYSLVVMGAGALLQGRGQKPHFLATYLNIGENVLFWALLSGVFQREGYMAWLFCVAAACAASVTWGLARRQFSFVASAAVYGYVGLTKILLLDLHGATEVMSYFLVTGVIMVVLLVQVARRFGRED